MLSLVFVVFVFRFFRMLAGLSWILVFSSCFYGVLCCFLSFPRGFSWLLGVLGHFTSCFAVFDRLNLAALSPGLSREVV